VHIDALPILLEVAEADRLVFPEVRWEAGHAMIRISANDLKWKQVGVGILEEALESSRVKKSAEMRLELAEKLSSAGIAGKRALSTVVEFLRDGLERSGLSMRNYDHYKCVLVIWRVGELPESDCGVLRDLLKSPENKDEMYRFFVAGTLLKVSPTDPIAKAELESRVPDAIRLLETPNAAVVAEILGMLGPNARDALPALRERRQRETDSDTRNIIESAIRRISTKER
jgi:hypothetical protein